MGRFLTLAVALAALALAGPARAGDYTVPWTGDFSQQTQAPDSAPAGSNDFSWRC